MKSQALVFAILTVGVLSVSLFTVSYQVQDLEEELRALDKSIARDRETIHVLKAEWAHLNDPRRLGVLAERHLGLAPIKTEQIGSLDTLPHRPLTPAPDETPAVAPSPPPQANAQLADRRAGQ